MLNSRCLLFLSFRYFSSLQAAFQSLDHNIQTTHLQDLTICGQHQLNSIQSSSTPVWPPSFPLPPQPPRMILLALNRPRFHGDDPDPL